MKYLFLTHCHYDHTGGAASVKNATGCKIVAHDLDAAFLEAGDSEVTAASWYGTWMEPLKVDIKVTAKEKFFTVGELEVAFYHAPGHSPGSAVLTTVSDGKLVLFGQDVHGPLNDSLRSVRRITRNPWNSCSPLTPIYCARATSACTWARRRSAIS